MWILALIPEASCARACLDAAASAARSQELAHVLALHVRVEPLKLLTSDEEVAIQLLRDSREGNADKRADEARREVEAWVEVAPSELAKLVEYKEVVGGEEEEVVRASRAAELLVMARPHNLDGHDAFHAAVFLARKSLLLAPADWSTDAGPRIERHILVAWKQCGQALRAVDGALPWLRVADKVTVLTVEKEGQRVNPTRLLESLSREGIEAEHVSAAPIDGRTSARILATADEIDASLIVMGAYRFGSLIEWALGATTQRTIAQAKIPLMLAH
jgi:Universal stress protein UspA and related nucleotide-binding proteins